MSGTVVTKFNKVHLHLLVQQWCLISAIFVVVRPLCDISYYTNAFSVVTFELHEIMHSCIKVNLNCKWQLTFPNKLEPLELCMERYIWLSSSVVDSFSVPGEI